MRTDRRARGRPTLQEGKRLETVCTTVSREQHDWLWVLGGGNVSKGVRLAIDRAGGPVAGRVGRPGPRPLVGAGDAWGDEEEAASGVAPYVPDLTGAVEGLRDGAGEEPIIGALEET